jgi:hypothetical protein
MGIYKIMRISDLGSGLILAPERFDPRRSIEIVSDHHIGDYFDIVTENISPASLLDGKQVLVLDTTHAYDGFTLFRHGTCMPQNIGSTKRKFKAGDVIISRLRPYLKQIAYIDESLFNLDTNGNHVAGSTEFFIIRSRGDVNPAGLIPFLLSDSVQNALAAGQEGGHHPRFSKELLQSISIPNTVIENIQNSSEKVIKTVKDVNTATSIMRSFTDRLNI